MLRRMEKLRYNEKKEKNNRSLMRWNSMRKQAIYDGWGTDGVNDGGRGGGAGPGAFRSHSSRP